MDGATEEAKDGAMNADRRRRGKEIFLAAREAAGAERSARLRELCQGDEVLLAEVTSLLEYDGRRGLEPPRAGESPAALALARDPDLTGRKVGEFVLIRLLGKGGMGMVWEAEQRHPRRRVAVKVLRRGIASREALRRFEHEVELLGRLQHPSIARVYAADTFEHEGEPIPYFAMELVQGALTLDAFVAGRALPLDERLRLFLPICEAVHHGHQRGVLHRDLKPSNVLVGTDGHPRVIDFGVARATDSDVALTTGHTQVGELVGTLAYMSPEQCAADPGGLDSRSDVYSLGVMLYELVCRRAPYDLRERSITAAALLIREHEPEPPGRLDRRLGGDLEAVVLKCLEKDRQRRYASASDLAADLRRYLAGDPVEARRPGPWRRLVRWIGRHPIATTAAACATLVGVALGSLFLGSSLARTPWSLRVDASGREAILLSASGSVLKRWETPAADGIAFAELIDRPVQLGGGRVAALALDFQPRSAELCLFETSDLDRPYWTSAAEPPLLPRDEPERAGTRFVVQAGLVADVFPEEPGEEIVVLHRLVPYSATAIRVYGLAGTLLYEAWNDGGLGVPRWLSRPRLLVLAGLDSEKPWNARGVELGASRALYPAIVFALRPEAGRVGLREFVVHRGSRRDPTLRWYEWLGPTEHLAALDDVLPVALAPGGNWSPEEYTQIELRTGAGSRLRPPPLFSLILDAGGEEAGRIVGDPYTRWERSGDLPPASVYRLLDFSELPYR